MFGVYTVGARLVRRN